MCAYKRITVGGVPEYFNTPWKMAIENHSFSHLSIAVEWKDFLSGTGAMIEAVENKNIDLAIVLTEGIIKYLDHNPKSTIKLIQHYISSPLKWGVYTYQTNSTSLFDQPQTKIAISKKGSGSHIMAMLYAKSQNIPLQTLEWVEGGNIYDMMKLLKKGQAHGFLWENNMMLPYVMDKSVHPIDIFFAPWEAFSYIARQDTMEAHHTLISEMTQIVYDEAIKFQKNPQSPSKIESDFNIPLTQANQCLKETLWTSPKNGINQTSLQKIREALQGG